ncbi:MAG: PAS domain S-box protein [Myxococcales bacterium]
MADQFDSLRARLWPIACDDSVLEPAFLDRYLAELAKGLEATEALLTDQFQHEHQWLVPGRPALPPQALAKLAREAHQHLVASDRAFTWTSAALGAESVGCPYRVLGQVGGALALLRPQPWGTREVAFVHEAAEILAGSLSRRRVETGLRQSELRYRIVSEMSAQYTFSASVRPDGRATLDWFSGMRHTGAEPAGALATLGERLGELSPEGKAVSHQVLEQCVRTNAPASGRFPVRRRGEGDRWLRIDMQPVWNAAEQRVARVYATVRDETDAIAAHEELERERDLWRDLVLAAPVGMASVSLEGLITDCNPALCTLLGARDKSQLVGRPVTDFAPRSNDSDRSKPLLSQVRAGKPLNGIRWTGRALDGLEIPVDAWVGLVRDAEGRPSHFSGLLVRARQSARQAAVDASEMGDLVSAILGNAGLALAALDRDSPARQDLLQVIAAAERAAALLRAPASPSPRQLTPRPRQRVAIVDAEELVRRAAGTILERDGYEVLLFESPAEALQSLAGSAPAPAAVVLDVRAPESDAAAALSQLRALRPRLPMLLTSSMPQHSVGAELEGVTLLHKPYSREQLLAALARALASFEA